MCTHWYHTDGNEKYNSAEHESLYAVLRCLALHRGEQYVTYISGWLLKTFGVDSFASVSPWGANFARKHLEQQLPLRSDFA